MISINENVVTGFTPINLGSSYAGVLPTAATPSCLSFTDAAPWTNRVPAHEPWPRTMMGDTPSANSPNPECKYNTSHNPQFVDDGGESSKSINRVEGIDILPRGQFWRR
jgi:hypothetical protein